MDMSDPKDYVHKGEFGTPAWCQAAARLGVALIEAANPDNTKWLQPSRELARLPETEWGVPIFSEMTDDQQAHFLRLLGR
jgi:hypothetical protein